MMRRSGIFREDGSTILEMAFGGAIYTTLLIGVIEMCLALFACHVTADAARQASRWAMVRGSTSCTNTPKLTDCGATAAEIQNYVTSLGYLGLTTNDVTVNWLSASGTYPTTWSACTTGTCNAPQSNSVQVTVTYPFKLGIPWLAAKSLSITSTSQVVISQ